MMYIILKGISVSEKRRWIKKDNGLPNILILLGLGFFIIMFAVLMGPIIFNNIGYEITDKSSITASDSISFVLEAILAATFAGLTLIKARD